jgi:type IV secretory pathway VirB3-like protein
MAQDVRLRTYPLFTGMTRPAMLMGVPLDFLVMALFPCIAFYIATATFFSTTFVFLALYAVGWLAARHDERFVCILRGKLSIHCPNKTYWNCHSYEPY